MRSNTTEAEARVGPSIDEVFGYPVAQAVFHVVDPPQRNSRSIVSGLLRNWTDSTQATGREHPSGLPPKPSDSTQATDSVPGPPGSAMRCGIVDSGQLIPAGAAVYFRPRTRVDGLKAGTG